jgi:hypothetical protein
MGRLALFAMDYPQAVHDDDEVAACVRAVRALGPQAQAIIAGVHAEKLIPNLSERHKGRAA